MSDYRTNYTFIPTNSAYSRINETSSYSITIIILIVCSCCLIILGGVAYYSSLNNNSSKPTSSQPSTTQPPTTTKSQMLYEFKEHKFTTAGKTGPTGPTLQEVKQAYAGVAWAQNSEFLNMTTQGIQEWKVPVTGTYKIQALGARGGGDGGGLGADITGTFSLSKNEVIKILVGQRGTLGFGDTINYYRSQNSGGGGGGSFVVKSDNNIILIIAGGGGGGGDHSGNYLTPKIEGFPANTTQNGTGSHDNGGGIKGKGGNSNKAWAPTAYDIAGSGGGGFYTSGENAGNGSFGGGSFIHSDGIGGLGGGVDYKGGDGGFGGGGGGWSRGVNRGGGGGGYSGGQGGSHTDGGGGRGGGGGSYINSENANNLAVTNKDNGSVTITLISY
jgi:hypothetical protein